MITLQLGQFGWDYLVVADDGRDLLVQNDYDYPGLATTFGWSGDAEDIAAAQEYLDNHLFESVEDPGYFE